ncbi:hypothetical protein DL766_003466 [Monosporascus sp. MC13-8B]|uniref:Swiss Army Knife RNA repair protein HAD domain-containing protein n=1 Tax=Monosporascus cannonballus TaxID=155416 RepID=A0ABY0HE27_9PEZI|nr:hypothetical protein DL762_003803 [Monosporascus cannonballus]RYP33435.1 hypothetical protein DL766_003466 [Monosporascus sp. MC13-8B]
MASNFPVRNSFTNGNREENGNTHGSSHRTLTALRRWSILSKRLPAVDTIDTIHVYDFDNTLFQTPLPNPKLWNTYTLGQLGSPEIFVNGGWWHDSRILAATGDGVEREEPRAWGGWWNEKIVELVRLSMKQRDALCVLLTGRSESGFSDLIRRIVTSKGLEFDLIGLKPAVGPNSERFRSTMEFKQIFLAAIIETYRQATEIRVYEDRPKHTAGFRTFFSEYNQRQQGLGPRASRGPIAAEVIQVAEISTNLDPVVEVAEVQHLVNSHNAIVSQRSHGGRRDRLMIKKTVFFTSYMIEPEGTKRLLGLVSIPNSLPDAEFKLHANQIMICPRPCPKSVLDEVGGMNAKMQWRVTATGCFENSIWAARVEPVPANAKYHIENPIPFVILAIRRGARPTDAARIQDWEPVSPEKSFILDTAVGEKVMLRIEPEDWNEDGHDNLFAGRHSKRKHAADDGGRSRNLGHGHNPRGNYHGRGSGNHGRGGFRGNHTPNRGYRTGQRGGGHFKGGGRGGKGYRSLDDVAARDGQDSYGSNASVSYDDNFPAMDKGLQQIGKPPQYGIPQQPQGGSWQGPGAGNQARHAGFGGGGPDFQNLY